MVRDWDAIKLDPTDNVGTALLFLEAGPVRVRCGETVFEVTVSEPIPMGHKLALTPLKPGDAIRKYGSVIGEAMADVAPGAHVHVHNLRGRRGRPSTPEQVG